MKQLRRFYSFIWQRPWLFISYLFIFIIATLLTNTKAFFIGAITNLVSQNELDQVLPILVAFGAAMIGSSLLINLAYWLENRNANYVSVAVVKQVLARVHSLDFAFHANKSSGKLISIFSRGDDAIWTFYEGLNDELLSIIISFTIMLSSFALLDIKYLGLVLLFMILTLLFSYHILRANLRARSRFNAADDDLSAVKVDNLVNFDTVKYFAKEKFEQRRLDKVLQNWFNMLQKYFITFRVFDLVVDNLSNIFLIVITVVAFFDLRAANINIGNFLFILTFLMTLLPQMRFVMHIVRNIAKKSEDLERYLGILDEPITVPDPPHPKKITNFPSQIVFKDVDFFYHSEHAVIHDFNLTIKPGEAIALVGFSGAGKTTIAKLLMRMYDVNAGSITIDGVDLRDMKKDYLRSLVGIVPQEPIMFNNTVFYNIAYARPEASREEIEAVAAQAQITDFINNLENGYDTMVGERGIKLSGGQRQRLAIARVLLQKTNLVIFDEATSSLDSQTEKYVQEAFWRMAKNKQHRVSSIIIAHRLSTVMRADRIVVMNEGKIVEVGSHQQLLANSSSTYKKLWDLQQDGFLGDGEAFPHP
ncbi:ABC transporter ATP-binding protein/permease [Microgenomates group bacterium]|nr:ABC transporter ATP-binding protein/permease [Microgenomates group bacterium]